MVVPARNAAATAQVATNLRSDTTTDSENGRLRCRRRGLVVNLGHKKPPIFTSGSALRARPLPRDGLRQPGHAAWRALISSQAPAKRRALSRTVAGVAPGENSAEPRPKPSAPAST